MFSYFLLFISAFGAATLFPFQSEALLAGLIMTGEHSPTALLIVATIGNALGSCVNWWLGTRLERYKDRKWFPVSEKTLSKAQAMYANHGSLLLLFSWLPIIGDPITLVSGVLKEKFWKFLVLVTVAKFVRYWLVYLMV